MKVNQEKVFTLVEVLNDENQEKENKFIIRDQLMMSSSNSDHIIDIGCKVNGEALYPYGSYMGLYTYKGKVLHSNIFKDWKIDCEHSRYIEIPTKGMKCNPDHYYVPLNKEM